MNRADDVNQLNKLLPTAKVMLYPDCYGTQLLEVKIPGAKDTFRYCVSTPEKNYWFGWRYTSSLLSVPLGKVKRYPKLVKILDELTQNIYEKMDNDWTRRMWCYQPYRMSQDQKAELAMLMLRYPFIRIEEECEGLLGSDVEEIA